eukprot:4882338-Alexandrium_andersonii.AAC.1
MDGWAAYLARFVGLAKRALLAAPAGGEVEGLELVARALARAADTWCKRHVAREGRSAKAGWL